jgi:glycosyltransferase involved in cell wall biosynthesis
MQNGNGKNILHVVNTYFVIPYFLGDQLKYFNKKGYKEHIICSPSKEIEAYSKKEEFQYQEIPIVRRFSIRDDLKAIRGIRKYIKEKNIDIVVGHTPKGALLAMIASWLEKAPKRIYFRHGLVFETSTGAKGKILKYTDIFTAKLSTQIVNVSPSVSQKAIELKLNKPEKQVILSKGTCNGISTSKFNAKNISRSKCLQIKHSLKIPNDSFIIGYTGRLVKDKGIVDLFLAFRYLKKKYKNIILLLVGFYEKRDALPQEIIEEIQKDTQIIVTGYVNYEEIEYYYSIMDVFILPSYREGFPTSILEASAMELPIITTRATGCIDSIIENITGLFIDHNPLEIAEAIEYFIQNKDKKIMFGKEGRKFIENNFDSEIIWKDLEKIYSR